jgi:hypothetical protein
MFKLCPFFSLSCRNWSPNYSVLVNSDFLKNAFLILLRHALSVASGQARVPEIIFLILEEVKIRKGSISHKLRKREDWTVRIIFLSLLIEHMMTI